MAHDKVYGFCESKCKVEVPTKKDFDELKTKAESFTGEVYQTMKTEIGSFSVDDTNTTMIRQVVPKKLLRYYYELTNGSSSGAHSVDVLFVAFYDVDGTGIIYRTSSGAAINNFDEDNDDSYLSVQNTVFITRATAIMENGSKHELGTMKSTEFLKETGSIANWFFTGVGQEFYNNIKYLIIERAGI